MACVITLMEPDMSTWIEGWTFTGPTVYFNKIFDYVIHYFDITPSIIRSKMTEMLKPTIVNNVAQLVAKYNSIESEEERNN
jgi:L-2-hydroxyglutarate oxidase LhgO